MTDQRLDPERAANLAENPYAGQGPVMLDIGGDVGAVVLHLPASLEGAEVEVEGASATADDAHDHAHTDDHAHTHGHEHSPDHKHDHEHEHEHHSHRLHVAVVGRPINDRIDYSAVFPALLAGRYLLHVPGAAEPVEVQVRGGEVTEATWHEDSPVSGV